MTPVLAEIVGWEFLLVLAVIAVLFGSSKIPDLARSLGAAAKEFKAGAAEDDDDTATTSVAAARPATPATETPATPANPATLANPTTEPVATAAPAEAVEPDPG
jgi:sec-independent protein translocase protein TatA